MRGTGKAYGEIYVYGARVAGVEAVIRLCRRKAARAGRVAGEGLMDQPMHDGGMSKTVVVRETINFSQN